MAAVWSSMELGKETSGGTSDQSTDVCTCKKGLPCVDKAVCDNCNAGFTFADANGLSPRIEGHASAGWLFPLRLVFPLMRLLLSSSRLVC
jgi:hypothetical protein